MSGGLSLRSKTLFSIILPLYACVFLAGSSTMTGQSDPKSQPPDLTRALNQREEGRTTLEDNVLVETQSHG